MSLSIEWDLGSIFEHVLRRVHRGGPMPELDVQFRPFVGMNHRARLRDGKLEVRLSDLLQSAEPKVIEALAAILLGKMYRRAAPPEMRLRYRRYVASPAVAERILETRRERGRKLSSGAAGRHYDLHTIFAALNREYFGGAIADVALSWSRRAATVRLGHFDSAHRAIVISRALDRPDARCAVEFVMYHEMLHVKLPPERGRGRRRIHTKEFRAEEKQFKEYREARATLRRISKGLLECGDLSPLFPTESKAATSRRTPNSTSQQR